MIGTLGCQKPSSRKLHIGEWDDMEIHHVSKLVHLYNCAIRRNDTLFGYPVIKPCLKSTLSVWTRNIWQRRLFCTRPHCQFAGIYFQQWSEWLAKPNMLLNHWCDLESLVGICHHRYSLPAIMSRLMSKLKRVRSLTACGQLLGSNSSLLCFLMIFRMLCSKSQLLIRRVYYAACPLLR